MSSEPTLDELEGKLAEEQRLYADLLARLDRVSELRAPYDAEPNLASELQAINRSDALTDASSEPAPGFIGRVLRRFLASELDATRLELSRQRAFNSELVRFLNRFAEATNRAAAAQAEFASALIGFSQRIDRLADAKDRLYAALGNRRADLLLEGMDQRLERVRLGLSRLSERVSSAETAASLARSELRTLARPAEGEAPSLSLSEAQLREAHYVAFEDRFRGSSEEIAERLSTYVPLFESRSPVLELGSGRGEFLELLKRAGIEARGVDGNREMVASCREKGLEAEAGDAVSHLQSLEAGALGGIFAAQLVEHLPTDSLPCFLASCHRAVRSGGRVVLETVNPQSLAGLLGFYRDLTHQKPLHPETLAFLLRAAGFRNVETRYQSPVSERARLLHVDADGGLAGLNENFDKLNALLFAEQDYAAIATKE